MDDVIKDLNKFWNNYYKLNEEDLNYFKSIDSSDFLSLAPSKKQIDALNLLKDSKNVIDYGCGNGWASIIMAKLGTSKITAVDLNENPIKQLNLFKKAYEVDDKITSLIIDDNWLKMQKDDSYDGFFSSNVIDVIPLNISESIIKEAKRILKKYSYAIFSINYYISIDEMKKRKWDVKDNSAFIDGILRLTSLSDEEWISVFTKYFNVIDVIHYAWPEEENENRRLFILKNDKV